MSERRPLLAVLILCSTALLHPASVSAQQLLQNGDFETGNLTCWSTQTLGNFHTP